MERFLFFSNFLYKFFIGMEFEKITIPSKNSHFAEYNIMNCFI